MPSRTRGLWWKEWRQLRLLRAAGAAMIFVAPVMLLSAAEAAKRGWVPLGAVQSFSASTVVQDALPMFLGFLVWPLLALMFVAQSYCGDVAAGTEWFWMERPVQPRRVWTTRLLASLSSLAAVLALHWVVWRLFVTVWGNPAGFDVVGKQTRWFLMGQFQLDDGRTSMFVGLLLAAAAFVAALAASALARSPMQALPLGLILAVLPFGLGQLMIALFPHALVGQINVVAGVPLLLFVAYVIASYRSSCRGEPAGRGKLVRGLSVLGIGLVAVVALAAPTGFWFTGHAEKLALAHSTVAASPTGDRLFVYNEQQGSGWLIDADTGDELLHIRPYVFDAAWNSDGERLAVARSGATTSMVLEIYDRDGTLLVEGLACDSCYDVAWSGERLAVSAYRHGRWGLDWVDPATRERTATEIGLGELLPQLLGPTQGGTAYVAMQTLLPGEPVNGSSEERMVLLLHTLNVATGKIGEPVSIEGIDRYYRFSSLAPDGSAMLLNRLREAAVIDLSDGSLRVVGRRPAWLQPDRLVWGERDGEDLAVFVDKDGTVRELGHFDGHGAYELVGSPDGHRLLLVRSPNVSSPGGLKRLQHWLYDVETANWTELEQTKVNDRHGWPTRPEWVNSDTVVLRGAGVLALVEPGVPGSLRYVKG